MPSASVRPPAAEADVLPRLRLGDPDFWLTLVAWVTIAFSAVQILLFAFGRDQGIYAVVADGIQAGRMPYRDVWDFKPPGIHLIFALAQSLFGKTMLAPRLLEVLGLGFAIYAFTRLSQASVGLKRVGLMGGALAALIHAQLEFWHTCQPETFGGYFTIGALVLCMSEPHRSRRWLTWAGAGVAFGCAFLLKPTLGGGALVCAAYFARNEFASVGTRRAALWPVLVMALFSLIPIVLCASWFIAKGAWADLRWTLFEFTPGYTKLGWEGRSAPQMYYLALEETFFKFSALAAAGFIALLLISPMHGREREAVFLVLGLISVHVAGIAMQGKFFAYHYAATLPFVAFLAGIGLYKLWRRCLASGAGGIIAFVSFVIVVTIMRTAARDLDSFWERSALRTRYLFGRAFGISAEMLDRELYRVADYSLDADQRVAFEIKRRTNPDARIYIWGFEPLIYRLAERRAASRFIYNVPQRVAWGKDWPRAELVRELAQKRPALILVQRNDVFAFVTGDSADSLTALDSFPELARFIAKAYVHTTSIEDFELYEIDPRVH